MDPSPRRADATRRGQRVAQGVPGAEPDEGSYIGLQAVGRGGGKYGLERRRRQVVRRLGGQPGRQEELDGEYGQAQAHGRPPVSRIPGCILAPIPVLADPPALRDLPAQARPAAAPLPGGSLRPIRAALAALPVALAACSHPLPTVTYLCEGGDSIVAGFGPRFAELHLPPDRVLRLPPVPAASGARYSDGRYALHTKGSEAVLERGGESFLTDCRSKSAALLPDTALTPFRARTVAESLDATLDSVKAGRAVPAAGAARVAATGPEPLGRQRPPGQAAAHRAGRHPASRPGSPITTSWTDASRSCGGR